MLGTLSEGRRSLSANSLSSSIVKAYAPLLSLKCTLHACAELQDLGKGGGICMYLYCAIPAGQPGTSAGFSSA